MEKQVFVNGIAYPVSREDHFNGVKHYGICGDDSEGNFRLGWIPEWLVEKPDAEPKVDNL